MTPEEARAKLLQMLQAAPDPFPLDRAALLSLGRAGGAVTRRLAAFVEGWVPDRS